MDGQNVTDALAVRPEDTGAEIHRFLDYAAGTPRDVPDPYYGGAEQFQILFDTLDRAAVMLIRRLQAASG